MKEKIIEFLKNSSSTLFRVGITIVIGYFTLKIIKRSLRKLLNKLTIDKAAVNFIMSILNVLLFILYIFIIADTLNIPLTSMAAILATFGVAIGLAVKDSLTNIANGILIIVTKPFKEGDYVIIGSEEGTITAIKMVTTILTTVDNKEIIIPNSSVTNSNITNFNALDTRRLDIAISINYTEDVEKIKKIISDICLKHPGIIDSSSFSVRVNAYEEFYVKYVVKAWVKTIDYWNIKYDLHEMILQGLLEQNIHFAFPKMELTNFNSIK